MLTVFRVWDSDRIFPWYGFGVVIDDSLILQRRTYAPMKKRGNFYVDAFTDAKAEEATEEQTNFFLAELRKDEIQKELELCWDLTKLNEIHQILVRK